jgi:hypothetical protein
MSVPVDLAEAVKKCDYRTLIGLGGNAPDCRSPSMSDNITILRCARGLHRDTRWSQGNLLAGLVPQRGYPEPWNRKDRVNPEMKR